MQKHGLMVVSLVLQMLLQQSKAADDWHVSIVFNIAWIQYGVQNSDYACVDPDKVNETALVLCRSSPLYSGLSSASSFTYNDVDDLRFSCKGDEDKISDCPTSQESHCHDALNVHCY